MDLFVSCIVLCVTSLLAGWSPLFVHAPAKRRWMTTMGVGVLIGSAFVHVLPEAIHTTYLQPRSNQAQTRTQHARLAQTMHPSGVPSPSIDASSPASIAAWNPLSSIAAGAQHSSEEAALHNFKSKRGAPTPQPQSASASVTATRKLAHSHDAQQRHLLGADEPAVKPTKGAEQATKSSSTKDHSHEGHDHAHAGHSHAKDLVPPSRPAPVTSPRLVDDETAVGSHLLHRLQPAATVPPSAILVASTAASTDSVPEQLLACFGEDHPSKYMGALLALGFVAMLLVDRCAGRRSSSLPTVSSYDDIESAPLQPSSSRSNQEGVELMSRQKSSPGLASPGHSSLGGGGSSGGGGAGGNGATSSSSASTGHGTTPRTKVGGGGGGSGAGSAHPTPVGSSGAAGSGAHLSFPSIASAHSHSPSAGGGSSSLLASPSSTSSSGASSRSAGSTPAYTIANDLHVLLGVVVYALVDGLSLGAEALGSAPVSSSAAAASSDSPLSLLLPRAPLAFGVSCFLMFQGRATPKAIQKLALLYAALTPVAAVATWTALASWPGESGAAGQFDPLSLPLGFGLLGLAKLFAAGALLFTVAVHILPEIQAQQGGAHGAPSSASGSAAAGAAGGSLSGHGHGGEGPGASPGSASNANSNSLQVPAGLSVRASSPSAASRHEEHPLLGVSSSHAGMASSLPPSSSDDGKSMPWRYVVALLCGLLTPLVLACMHTPKILR